MKIVLLCSILFCVIAMPTLGQLTDADLDKIRLIVQEEIKIEITASEKRMKEYINLKMEGVDKQFAGVDKQFAGVDKQFEAVNNQITHSRRITYGLIALIVAAVGIPQIVMAWRSKKDRTPVNYYRFPTSKSSKTRVT